MNQSKTRYSSKSRSIEYLCISFGFTKIVTSWKSSWTNGKMSVDPTSSAVADETISKDKDINACRFIKSICQDKSTMSNKLSKQLTKDLLFSNLKSYDTLITAIKSVGKSQNNNVTIIVQPKPQQGKHIVKYQFTFVNDDDSDDESDDDDDDDNKNNHCGNDQFGGLSDTDLGASKY